MSKNNSDPVGTLSIGNVVTMGTILYKSNFKRYFQVSLRSTGWLIAIGFAAIGLAIIFVILEQITNSSLSSIPVIIAGIPIALYCLAKYATNRAVICRLAYQELIDKPETIADATKELLPRTWGFLRLTWLVGLYLFSVATVGYLVFGFLVVFVTAIAMYVFSLSTENPLMILSISLAIVGGFLWWIITLTRYYAYWFIAELPLAVEQTTSARFSITRSNRLIKTATIRVILIITIAFVITIPTLLGNVISFLGQIVSVSQVADDLSTGRILVLVGLLINLIGELFVMPFWQTIKAIVYYDLRNRQEGNDLIL